MKKTFILSILLLFLLSFTLASDPAEKPLMEPPEWIIGVWDDGSDMIGYEFTTYDVQQLFTSYPSFSQMGAGDQAVLVIDSVSTHLYSFSLLVPAAFMTQSYDFVKMSDSTLHYYVTTNDRKNGPILLKKQ
jgi:hypothetical protein